MVKGYVSNKEGRRGQCLMPLSLREALGHRNLKSWDWGGGPTNLRTELDPQNPCEKKCCEYYCCNAGRGGDRRNPGSHWAAHLAAGRVWSVSDCFKSQHLRKDSQVTSGVYSYGHAMHPSTPVPTWLRSFFSDLDLRGVCLPLPPKFWN